jgi:hypothetical protein
MGMTDAEVWDRDMLLTEASDWEQDDPGLSRAAKRGAEAIEEVARLKAENELLGKAVMLHAPADIENGRMRAALEAVLEALDGRVHSRDALRALSIARAALSGERKGGYDGSV